MEQALRGVVNLAEDTVHIIDLGPARGVALRRIRALGKARMVMPRRHQIL